MRLPFGIRHPVIWIHRRPTCPTCGAGEGTMWCAHRWWCWRMMVGRVCGFGQRWIRQKRYSHLCPICDRLVFNRPYAAVGCRRHQITYSLLVRLSPGQLDRLRRRLDPDPCQEEKPWPERKNPWLNP